MNMTQAIMIIRNHPAYLPSRVREAAVYVLGSLTAKSEDVQLASHILAIGNGHQQWTQNDRYGALFATREAATACLDKIRSDKYAYSVNQWAGGQ